MNVKLLRRIQKHILAEPRRFAMGTWISKGKPGQRVTGSIFTSNKFERVQRLPECGTAACIGGWAEIFSRTTNARAALDLPPHSAPLFVANNWPEPFRSRYEKGRTPLQRARIAAERIDHFIATKGAE